MGMAGRLGSDERDACALCGAAGWITFHHLIPRSCHKNKWFKKNFTRSDMHSGIHICRRCHSFLHRQFSEKQLGRDLNTLEKLLSHEMVVRFVTWASKQR